MLLLASRVSSIQLVALRTTGWTATASRVYVFAMIRRRNIFDPLEPTKEPRWVVVRSMHNALLEARALSPGSDLKRAYVALMLEWIDAGWKLGEFSSTSGTFFCTRGVERRMISIMPTDPGDARMEGPAHGGHCPSCED